MKPAAVRHNLRLVLGSTFSGWDLVTYPVGVLLGYVVHRRLDRRRWRCARQDSNLRPWD